MIGVIGGNGVAATNKLCQLIEEKVTRNGAYRDAHHPEMVIWQATQAPSRSMYLEGRGPSWIEDYVDIGKKLKECGCTRLCMCCNTAHYAIDELEEKIGLPFINLLLLVARECNKKGMKRIGMMCSDGLRLVRLYDKQFEAINPDIELVYPDEEYQKLVTLGICNSKNKIRFENALKSEDHPYNCFLKVCKHLQNDKNVDGIVSGCTDINNVFSTLNLNEDEDIKLNIIDSLDVLAEEIVHYNNN